MKEYEILVVEPEALIRSILCDALNRLPGFKVVHETGKYEEALEQALALEPDLIVTEIVLEGSSGIELIRQLREQGQNGRIVILTSLGAPELVKDAMLAGAHSYVLKRGSFQKLTVALERASQGQTYLESAISPPRNYYDLLGSEAETDPLAILTPREREIFHLLATGIRNNDIAKRLYISPRTVETHRSRISRKMGFETNGELIRFAIKHGLTQV